MKWKCFRFSFLFVESTVLWAAVNIVDFTIHLWIKPVAAAFLLFCCRINLWSVNCNVGGRQRTPNLKPANPQMTRHQRDLKKTVIRTRTSSHIKGFIVFAFSFYVFQIFQCDETNNCKIRRIRCERCDSN